MVMMVMKMEREIVFSISYYYIYCREDKRNYDIPKLSDSCKNHFFKLVFSSVGLKKSFF